MSSKQQIEKDKQRITELTTGIRYEIQNADIALAALQLANRYITKTDNQRIMINKIKNNEPKNGEWIDTETIDCIYIKHRICSVCGQEPSAWSKSVFFNYCPNCGAKMKRTEVED